MIIILLKALSVFIVTLLIQTHTGMLKMLNKVIVIIIAGLIY